jgi:chlorophyll synthase
MISTPENPVPLGKKIQAHISLADPVTWISPSIICICGALASGTATGFDWSRPQHWGLIMLGALLTGPLGTGFSQSINDYYDRDIDAINDPDRPIPAGLISLTEARINWGFLALATIAVALIFGKPLIVFLALIGLVLSVIYSMPPIKLKKNYWLGPPAVGLGYISVSWMVGHLIFAPLTWQSIVVAIINGGIAAGLLFLNDIKSVEGDRELGLKSLPVALGMQPALMVAYVTMNGFQAMLMVLAFVWGQLWVGLFMLLAIIAPIPNQVMLYRQPSQQNYKRYLIATNPFIVLIQFVSAFLVGGYFG